MCRNLRVDDEDDFRRCAAEWLRRSSHSVVECSKGTEDRARLHDQVFDGVLTDLRVPGPNGLDVLWEAAQKNPTGIRILLSAFYSRGDPQDVPALQLDGLLRKPLNLELLVQQVEALVRSKKLPSRKPREVSEASPG
jgi:CheY-like chemotaxis protein